MRQSATVTMAASWLATCVLAVSQAIAAADPPVDWRSAEGVRQQLEQPVSISWSGVPLRQAVANLARA
jgi:hypothetical protein